MEKYQQNIFDLMVKKEERLADLYTIFSECFKEFKLFWEKMAKDERSHASWLEKLKEAEEKSLITFDEGKIKTYTMETFLKHLDGLIAGATKNEISAKKAFSVALDLERSLIETKTFQHFTSFSEEGARILGLLDEELRKHIDIVGDMKKKFG